VNDPPFEFFSESGVFGADCSECEHPENSRFYFLPGLLSNEISVVLDVVDYLTKFFLELFGIEIDNGTRRCQPSRSANLRHAVNKLYATLLGLPYRVHAHLSPTSITLLSIFLLIACGFRKLAGHGVECQAMAAEY
jgi:hypothetical protein